MNQLKSLLITLLIALPCSRPLAYAENSSVTGAEFILHSLFQVGLPDDSIDIKIRLCKGSSTQLCSNIGTYNVTPDSSKGLNTISIHDPIKINLCNEQLIVAIQKQLRKEEVFHFLIELKRPGLQNRVKDAFGLTSSTFDQQSVKLPDPIIDQSFSFESKGEYGLNTAYYYSAQGAIRLRQFSSTCSP